MAVKKTTKKKPIAKKKVSRKKTIKKQTFVALVIDESRSMGGLEKSLVSGVNEQLNSIRKNAKLGGTTKITRIHFNDRVNKVLDKVAAKDVKDITLVDYVTGGTTALYDATLTAIKSLQEGVKETADTGYLVVVFSDGYENSSREISAADLSKKIKELQDTGKWTFVYQMGGQDLVNAVVRNLGILVSNTVSFDKSADGIKGVYTATADSSDRYLSMRSAGITHTADFYGGGTSTGVTDSAVTPLPPPDPTTSSDKKDSRPDCGFDGKHHI